VKRGVGELSERLRQLPAVGAVLAAPEVAPLLRELPREVVVRAVREAIGEARQSVQAGHEPGEVLAAVPVRAVELASRHGRIGLRRVVNATGVVLHTNLGRAVLPEAAVQAVVEAATRYSNLEYDLQSGKRGSRDAHLREAIKLVSGAEDGLAVNNNAGAVLLMLNTLADRREAIVSRGELVEIGGSFRIPDIIKKSGARLREVGTTNRTHPDDYRQAIGPRTALLLKVHTSNYRIVGFTAEVPAAELADLAHQHGLPLLYDLGSGAAFDYGPVAVASGESTIRQAVSSGADVVTASGDKLLGGPQAGIVAGRAELLERARRNPLARALRADKLTIAALQATLALYLREQETTEPAAACVPVVAMITRSAETLKGQALALGEAVGAACAGRCQVKVVEGSSEVGGGAFPTLSLPTWLVAVRHPALEAGAFAALLRSAAVPVLARVEEGLVLLDPRTLLAGEAELVARAIGFACARADGEEV
jgi:L-seryl-tRNA(Ser) seleniumtransferase